MLIRNLFTSYAIWLPTIDADLPWVTEVISFFVRSAREKSSGTQGNADYPRRANYSYPALNVNRESVHRSLDKPNFIIYERRNREINVS